MLAQLALLDKHQLEEQQHALLALLDVPPVAPREQQSPVRLAMSTSDFQVESVLLALLDSHLQEEQPHVLPAQLDVQRAAHLGPLLHA